MPRHDSTLSAASMSHPRAHTTGSIAALLRERFGAELAGDGSIAITHLETLDRAGPGALTFVRNGGAARGWPTSRASAALVTKGVEVPCGPGRAVITVQDADLALIELLDAFKPPVTAPEPGIHPTAVVHPSAQIGAGASIGPWCIVGAESRIGEGCSLVAHVFLGSRVTLGAGTTLHPHVTVLDRCSIGRACTLHSGAVVGADGFGYRPAPDKRGVVKIPHIGTVEIGDGVEIGACTCIDRAKIGATTIGDGTKIDNLVQIGHGSRLGRSCLIAGQAGISGSVTLGDGVMMGGQSGVADNLTVGAGVKLAAKSGIKSDTPPGEEMYGLPARPAREALRDYATLLKMLEDYRAARDERKRDTRKRDGA